jgi:hypothetical protein
VITAKVQLHEFEKVGLVWVYSERGGEKDEDFFLQRPGRRNVA